MTRKIFLVILFFIFYFLFSVGHVAFAHDGEDHDIDVGGDSPDVRIAELQRQIDELENQAKQYRTNIASEKAKGESLQQEIAVLKNEIKGLETQIKLTTKKIHKTKVEISGLETTIFDTQEKIDKQKDGIGRLILFMNQLDNQSLVATLIKNKNISDFFNHQQYANRVSTELIGLIDELNKTKQILENDKTSLQSKKNQLEELHQEQNAKKLSLGDVKNQKANLLTETKGQEAQYQKMLQQVERQEAEFYTELKKLENEAIAGGLYIVHIQATDVPRKGIKIFNWPEDGYRITQGYGMTARARRGAYGGAGHNGIDMASGYGSNIKAIGDGEVIANGTNKGWGNWIAVRHLNNMVSLYAHMSSISGLGLRVGAKVNTGDVLGYEGSTGNSTGSHVHLSVYTDFFTFNKNGELYFNYFEGTINPLDYL